ncbi:hypothetical protein B0H14DRAFT_2564415 [Mycena olivaceomarginata]|nr:hypothetical protein B0H14DRAFT_2564415 [Mycena olivaceomarginata]
MPIECRSQSRPCVAVSWSLSSGNRHVLDQKRKSKEMVDKTDEEAVEGLERWKRRQRKRPGRQWVQWKGSGGCGGRAAKEESEAKKASEVRRASPPPLGWGITRSILLLQLKGLGRKPAQNFAGTPASKTEVESGHAVQNGDQPHPEPASFCLTAIDAPPRAQLSVMRFKMVTSRLSDGDPNGKWHSRATKSPSRHIYFLDCKTAGHSPQTFKESVEKCDTIIPHI